MIMIDTEDGKKAEFYEPQCPYGNKNRKVSKAKQAYNVPVDYCLVKYVKKPANSKPGMVIYSNNKTIYAKLDF